MTTQTPEEWFEENYKAIYDAKWPLIASLPDLRLFQSEEAKKSVREWKEALAWEMLVDDLNTLLHEAPNTEADRVLLDLLVRLSLTEDSGAVSEIVEYHLKDLYTWCSTYPVLSYVLLAEERLYHFAVAGDHPNLRLMLHEVILRDVNGFYKNEPVNDRTKKIFHILPGIIWNRVSLALYASSQETSDWLLENVKVVEKSLRYTEMWDNKYVVTSLWKKGIRTDDLFTLACISDAMTVVLGFFREQPNKDGDTNYLRVHTVLYYLSNPESVRLVLGELREYRRIGEAAHESILRILNYGRSLSDGRTGRTLRVVHEIFPFDQSVRDEWPLLVDALRDNNVELIDACLEIGIGLDGDETHHPLRYCLHSSYGSTLRYLLTKYEYDPYSLLLDASDSIFEYEDDTALKLVLEKHQYTKEQLTVALSHAMGDTEMLGDERKIRLLLEALGHHRPKNEDRQTPSYHLKK